MRGFHRAALLAVICCALAGVAAPPVVLAAPQEQSAETSGSVTRIKQRLARPARSFTPTTPVQLRPTFRSRTDQHVFVLTLEEDLHKTFDLTDFQRQYAEYASRSGFDLGVIFRKVDKALEERQIRKTREQIARELAELKAASK